jgi:hypothetical protein
MMRHQAATMIIAVVAAYSLFAPAISQAAYPACQNGDVDVAASGMSPGAGHRGVELEFSLAPNHAPCTLTGYPGVDAGSGGPLVHAERTLRGYLGGVAGHAFSTPTLGPRHGAVAVVEGVAIDDNGDQCPTYTNLLVTPPNTTETITVDATIDTCTLQVHPVE